MFAAGIVITLAGVLVLLFSALQRRGYYTLLDGDADQYSRLHRRMILSFGIGIFLIAAGSLCMFFGR